MNAYDRDNIDYLLRNPRGEATWFTANLLRLIAKADPLNLAILRNAYPEEVEAVDGWREAMKPGPFPLEPEPLVDLVHAGRAAHQYVVEWHHAGRDRKQRLADALAPFEFIP